MTFCETQKKAQKYKIDCVKLWVASEVDGTCCNNISNDEEFEEVCKAVYNAYLEDDACDFSIGTLASACNFLLESKSELTSSKILDVACYL